MFRFQSRLLGIRVLRNCCQTRNDMLSSRTTTPSFNPKSPALNRHIKALSPTAQCYVLLHPLFCSKAKHALSLVPFPDLKPNMRFKSAGATPEAARTWTLNPKPLSKERLRLGPGAIEARGSSTGCCQLQLPFGHIRMYPIKKAERDRDLCICDKLQPDQDFTSPRSSTRRGTLVVAHYPWHGEGAREGEIVATKERDSPQNGGGLDARKA